MKKMFKRWTAVFTALLLTVGTFAFAGADYAEATGETVTVKLSFDCDSLGTPQALSELDINLQMSDVEVSIPKGGTVYDAIKAASGKESAIKVDENAKYISSAYGLGNALSGISDKLGYSDSLPTYPNYSWAGWNFIVDGKLSEVGASQYELNNDTDVTFRYMLSYKDGGAYDWDFTDAYKGVEKNIEKAESISRGDYTEKQLEYIDKFLSESKGVKDEIDNESQGLWVYYYVNKGTGIWGSGSPTEKLQKASENLDKAINREYYEIEGVEATCGDVYIGEKTKINVEVKPEGVPQECTYEALIGNAEVSEDGYITGIKTGKEVVTITSKVDSSKSTILTVDVNPAPVYNIIFTSDEAEISSDDVTVKDSKDQEITPQDGKFALTAGQYTYVVKADGRQDKKGTLIVSEELFKADEDNEIKISYDNSAEEKIYAETAKYIEKNLAPNYEDWAFMGLARSQKISDEDAEAYYKKTAEYVKTLESDRPYATDYARVIIGLTAAGWDVTDVDGINLLEKLADMDFITNQGLNGAAYTLIAYDCHDYEIPASKENSVQTTREGLVEYILNDQKTAGGWSWDRFSEDMDIDMTAMALQALAPYYAKDAEVQEACDKAIALLAQKQEVDGTYISWGAKSASSMAEVIVALASLDINPDSDMRFVKNGNSLIDGLNSLAAKGGGYVYNGEQANEFSTRSGYYAMVSYNRYINGEAGLYDMSDVEIKANPGTGTSDNDTNAGDNQKPGQTTVVDVDKGTGQVDTGDDFPMIIFIGMAFIALAAMAALVTVKRRENR